MDKQALLYPILALIVLSATVLIAVYLSRVREARARRIPIQAMATRVGAAPLLAGVSGKSDNLQNLFELPVLFYVLMTLLYVDGRAQPFFVVSAWVYVMLRAIHSYIHCTYNRVQHRLIVFALSSAVLLAMWAVYAWRVVAGA